MQSQEVGRNLLEVINTKHILNKFASDEAYSQSDAQATLLALFGKQDYDTYAFDLALDEISDQMESSSQIDIDSVIDQWSLPLFPISSGDALKSSGLLRGLIPAKAWATIEIEPPADAGDEEMDFDNLAVSISCIQ
jgi:hypothetical protein